jgi:elongation factor P hydroxylase
MGGAEPSYHPSTSHSPATIVYAHGYFASALHEIAHWCVAGRRRRQLHDFGYWYEPDGRPYAQQVAFERVEVVPQALESLFHAAAGTEFHASADNLSGGAAALASFRVRVLERAQTFQQQGLPPRAAAWCRALQQARMAGMFGFQHRVLG